MKVFIGATEISSVLAGMAKGFKELGHYVKTFVFEKNRFYQHFEYDFVYPRPLQSVLKYEGRNLPSGFLKALRVADQQLVDLRLNFRTRRWIDEFDLFVFIWNPWLHERELFKSIKEKGKKIVVYHMGGDVRHAIPFLQEFPVSDPDFIRALGSEDINYKIEKVRLHELYADAIFSVPDQAGLYIRSYYHAFLPLHDIEEYNYSFKANSPALVMHCPSDSNIKGSSFIYQAVNELRREGFLFETYQNLPHTVLLEKLAKASILIDELYGHGPGVLSTEAMAMGCAVLTHYLEEYRQIFPAPVINISKDNVKQKLQMVMDGHFNMEELAQQGRDFVNRYNHPKKVCEYILNVLEGGIKPHYYPDFYLEKFVLPETVHVNKRNQELTDEVLRKYHLGTAGVRQKEMGLQ